MVESIVHHATMLFALVTLAGCGREQIQVRTNAVNGRIVFGVAGKLGLFRRQPCLANFSIQDREENVVWKIDRQPNFSCERIVGFPLTYGKVSVGFASRSERHHLHPASIYYIKGEDVRTKATYVGGFRITAEGGVDSFTSYSPEVQEVLSEWMARHPHPSVR
jgi:hypothetical protein